MLKQAVKRHVDQQMELLAAQIREMVQAIEPGSGQEAGRVTRALALALRNDLDSVLASWRDKALRAAAEAVATTGHSNASMRSMVARAITEPLAPDIPTTTGGFAPFSLKDELLQVLTLTDD